MWIKPLSLILHVRQCSSWLELHFICVACLPNEKFSSFIFKHDSALYILHFNSINHENYVWMWIWNILAILCCTLRIDNFYSLIFCIWRRMKIDENFNSIYVYAWYFQAISFLLMNKWWHWWRNILIEF